MPGPVGRPGRRAAHLPPGRRDRPGARALLHPRRRHDRRQPPGRRSATCSTSPSSRRRRVVSVEYRLAPETPHPGPVEDCYAGLLWTVEHADELGVDPERIVVVGGSAGGGLAAALALLARDRGGPALAGQLLMCPMLDDRNDTPSAHQMAGLRDVGPAGQRGRLDGAARRRPRRPGRLAVRRAGPRRPTSPACRRVHRRRVGGDLPRRGRRLREPHLAGRRRRRAARLARRLPRLRRHRAGRSDMGSVPDSRGRARNPGSGSSRRRIGGVGSRSMGSSGRPPSRAAPRISPAKDSHATHPVQRRLGDPAARQLLPRDGRRRGAVAAGHAAARRGTGPRPRPRRPLDHRLRPRRRVRVPEDARRARGVPRPAGAAGVRGRLPHGDGLRERRARRPAGRTGTPASPSTSTTTCCYGEDNEIRVVCRAHEDSRWYSGAGIHRPVHLVVGRARRTSPWTASASRRPTSTTSSPSSRSRRRSSTTAAAWRTLDLVTEIRDGDGAVVATATSPVTVLPGEPAVVRQRLLRARARAVEPRLARRCTRRRSPCATATTDVDDDTVDLRHPHPVARPRARAADQRRAGQAARRVRPPRQRRARRGDDRPRRGAPGRAAQGGRLQRAAQRAQPDEPGDARRLRPARHAGHGRAHRHVDREQDRLRRARWTSRSGGSATSRRWCARTSTTRASSCTRSATRSPRSAKPHGARLVAAAGREGARRSTTPGSSPTASTRMLAVDRRGAERDGRQPRRGINTMLTDMGAFMDELVGVRARRRRGRRSPTTCSTSPGMNYMEARYEIDRELFPQPGDRRHRRPSRARSTGSGGSCRDNPHVIGDFTWTGWDYLGEAGIGRVDDRRRPDRRASSGRPTRGCSRTSATSTSPATAGPRPTTGRSSSACAATRTSRCCGPSTTAASCRPTPWAWTRHGRQLDAGPAPRARRSPSRSTATPTRSSCCWTAGRSGVAPVGEKNRFRAEFEVTYAPGELVAVARTGGEETGRFALRSATGPVVLAAAADRRRDPRRRRPTSPTSTITLQDADGTVVARRRPRGDRDRRGPGRAGRASAAPRRRPRSPTSTTSTPRSTAARWPSSARPAPGRSP